MVKGRKGRTGADSVNTNQTIVCSCLVCRRYSANTNLFKTTTSGATYFFFSGHWYSKWLVRFDIGWCKANPHIYRTPWKALSLLVYFLVKVTTRTWDKGRVCWRIYCRGCTCGALDSFRFHHMVLVMNYRHVDEGNLNGIQCSLNLSDTYIFKNFTNLQQWDI